MYLFELCTHHLEKWSLKKKTFKYLDVHVDIIIQIFEIITDTNAVLKLISNVEHLSYGMYWSILKWKWLVVWFFIRAR